MGNDNQSFFCKSCDDLLCVSRDSEYTLITSKRRDSLNSRCIYDDYEVKRIQAFYRAFSSRKSLREQFKEELQRRKIDLILDTPPGLTNDIQAYLTPEMQKIDNKLEPFIADYSNNSVSTISVDLVRMRYQRNEFLYKGHIDLQGRPKGYGIILQTNKLKMEGIFANGVLAGRGRVIYSDGYYVGSFVNGVFHGHGELFKNGIFYEGQFCHGLKEGKGKEIGDDKSIYVGDFKSDCKNGKGSVIFQDGSNYEGDWLDDQMTGHGTLTYFYGSRYEGEFKENKRQGKGRYYWNERKFYEGEWKDDQESGMGFIVDNGEKVEGQFKGGKFLFD